MMSLKKRIVMGKGGVLNRTACYTLYVLTTGPVINLTIGFRVAKAGDIPAAIGTNGEKKLPRYGSNVAVCVALASIG